MSENSDIKRMPRKILGINNSRNQTIVNQETYSAVNSPPTSPQSEMDRIRLGNIMNQEFHSFFPYGATYLSPILPAHNVAVPYALAAGGMPYAALPMYQPAVSAPMNATIPSASPCGGGGGCSSTSCASSSTGGRSSNDSNKMFIQIGLQCVNQNNPLNINSLNDMGLMNFADADMKKGECSLQRSSPIILSADNDMAGKSCTAGGGDATNSAIILSEAKCNEFIHLSLYGSEVSEKVAYGHRNRPCFKKIDSLCARTKQDLIRPDGVLPNINSQGIAWAVKDLIFVFTRLVNAWIIVKGYVYKTPEGLNKVKSSLSPEFARSFITWHDATRSFIDNIIQSIMNLENLVQSQKNIYQKVDSNGTKSPANNTTFSSTPIKLPQTETAAAAAQSQQTQSISKSSSIFDESSFDFLNTSNDNTTNKSNENLNCNKKYLYTMVEDSEGSQRQATVNGTYFKTGTYNPIKKDSPITVVSEQEASTNASPLDHVETAFANWPNGFHDVLRDLAAPYAKTNSTEEIPLSDWIHYDIRVLEKNLTECSSDYDPNEPPKPLGKDLINKLNTFIERLMVMKTADIFFKKQFFSNYFPDFIANNQVAIMDVRSIILKCQGGGYSHIFEAVHDVRKIIFTVKSFLETNKNSQLEKSVLTFEKEFNQILSEEPFENYQFDHINGEPEEILYNCRK